MAFYHVLRPPCWRYRGGSSTKKIGNPKNQFTCFFCFSIFQAVWCSHNLERLYIFLTKAVLQSPCWRYGRGSFTKKINNPNIGNTCFLVCNILRTSIYIGIYIYNNSHNMATPLEIQRWVFFKKDENPKLGYTCFFVLPYFEPFSTHATLNFSIYRYIYIITVKLQPTCWRYRGRSLQKR